MDHISLRIRTPPADSASDEEDSEVKREHRIQTNTYMGILKTCGVLAIIFGFILYITTSM